MKTGMFRQRASWTLLWGALMILGWAVLSSLLGAGAAQAADEPHDEPRSLLSRVSDQLSATTDKVADVADAAVGTAVKPAADTVVTPVTQAVVTPVAEAVIKPVTKTVVKPVTKAVVKPVAETVIKPVAEAAKRVVDAADEGVVAPVVSTVEETVAATVRAVPVTRVLETVTDTVAEVPVAGRVLETIGVLEVVDRAADTVNDVLHTADPGPSMTPPQVSDPPLPSDLAPASVPMTAQGQTADAAATDARAWMPAHRLGLWSTAHAVMATGASQSTSRPGDGGDSPASTPPGPPDEPASPTSSAGPSGSSAGVPANAHPLTNIHADTWMTRSASSNSALPPSPAASTDISPD